jgi:hypothetical protein
MSAKRCTSSGERSAARPTLSGHSENMLDVADAAGLSTKPWRGSVPNVIGMPRPDRDTRSCAAFTHCAKARGSNAGPTT